VTSSCFSHLLSCGDAFSFPFSFSLSSTACLVLKFSAISSSARRSPVNFPVSLASCDATYPDGMFSPWDPSGLFFFFSKGSVADAVSPPFLLPFTSRPQARLLPAPRLFFLAPFLFPPLPHGFFSSPPEGWNFRCRRKHPCETSFFFQQFCFFCDLFPMGLWPFGFFFFLLLICFLWAFPLHRRWGVYVV